MTIQSAALSMCLLLSASFAEPALAEIRIAVAGPMKGQFGQFGAQMQAGAEQAVADINAAGGLNGEQLVLDIVDDGCNETQAVAVANQLIGKGVRLVAGHFCFGASMLASEIYSKAGIVQISPATTLPNYTEMRPGPGIYRLAPRDDHQAQVAGALLTEEFADETIAILHDKTAYGKALADAVKTEINDLGKSESLYQGFDSGQSDYRILVSRLALENVGVVFLGGYHPEAGLIKLEMDRQGQKNVTLIGGDTLMNEEYWSVTGAAGNGTLMTHPQDPRDLAEAQSIVRVLEEAEKSSEKYALSTYAAIQAWSQAVETAQSIEFDAVTGALDEGEFFTILGDFSFDEKGDSSLPGYVVYEWRDGEPKLR
ncbi:MAG: branched-chain amino acid ABC transporter substrate-binding protein [Roseibium sp.]